MMKHLASPTFWACYDRLPITIQALADKNFALLKTNPYHPSLHLKNVGKYWSVRVGKKYRAIAIESSQGLVWFWIGTHTEYEKIIQS